MFHDGPMEESGTTAAVQVKVTGRVQGVAFRWEAQHQAERLGARGWVRNEPDGSVVAHVEGEPDVVNDMVVWLRQGPPGSRVRDVAVREAAPTGATSFEITG
jgi:acylphosphatase